MKKQPREVILAKARNSIQVLCNKLNISSQISENAYVYFSMAFKRFFTKGRKSELTYAASVYIACRMERTMHLLLDVADAGEINAFELGRTYSKMLQAISLSVPNLDPSVFLLRYVNLLDFGDKTNAVYNTAMRILLRMMKDSIHIGRKQSGLCGAALLIAGRLHGFNHTTNDIIKVVHCHRKTLKKRLLDFQGTQSSRLTFDQFMTIDLEYTHDPPSYQIARAKDKELIDTFFKANNCGEVIDEVNTGIVEKERRNKDIEVFGVKLAEIGAEVPEPRVSSQTINVGPSLEMMGLSNNKRTYEDDDEEEITYNVEIDEDEIDSYILSKESHQIKRSFWLKMYGTAYKKLLLNRKKAKDSKVAKKEAKELPAKELPAKTDDDVLKPILKKKKLLSLINSKLFDDFEISDTDALSLSKLSEL